MTRPRDLVAKLHTLSDREVAELYSRLWTQATEMNPLREWVLRMNPTREDLSELLQVLPPRDLEKIEFEYFT